MKKALKTACPTIAGLIWLVAAAPLFADSSTAVFCGTVITEPGRYHLAQDLSCNDPAEAAISVQSSDVLLNFRGNTLTCGPEVQYGVLVGSNVPVPGGANAFGRVHLRNGTITG